MNVGRRATVAVLTIICPWTRKKRKIRQRKRTTINERVKHPKYKISFMGEEINKLVHNIFIPRERQQTQPNKRTGTHQK